MNDLLRLRGRVLFLAEDAALVRRQLDGADVEWPAFALRHDISTDEITPAWACYYPDERLGEYAYVGLRCGGEFPIAPGAVRRGGFEVSVSGRRRGKGSSREASPYAERAAGIRLVIAESFERIYRENCQHLGVYTSTDFGLLELIARGEPIPIARLTAGLGAITRGIVRRGGLLAYGQARLAGRARVPAPSSGGRAGRRGTPRPMTLAEKIIARHWAASPADTAAGIASVRPGDEGFVRADLRFSHEYVTPMAAELWRGAVGSAAHVRDPGSILFFRDHLTFLDQALTDERRAAGLLDVALELKSRQEAFAAEQGIRLYGELPPRSGAPRGAEGICHSIVLERHALPGQVIVGSDSHTPHSGAVGCVAFGVGTTAICHAWLTGDVRLTVPPSVLVRVRGRLPANVAAKDLVLAILREPFVRDGGAVGRIVEYAGEAVTALSVDERATLTNMAAEIGAFTGIVAPDGVVVQWLERARGVAHAEALGLIEGLASDADAEHEAVLDIDASALRPMVALPGDPGNGRFLDELRGPVPVDIAYAGSCTGGKCEDMDMYARVFRAAAARGARVHEGVRCYVQFGSQTVRRHAEARGYVELFRAVGAQVLEPSCGACINAGPGVSFARETVTVSAINRNFPGRSGPGQVYLASPYTVAASAIAGRIAAWEGDGEGFA
ncbi:MAG TPA: aconitase family protein [Gemmatimonadales bacterium]|nr:aconitase family protein [Gemmatimonadales bacterium]